MRHPLSAYIATSSLVKPYYEWEFRLGRWPLFTSFEKQIRERRMQATAPGVWSPYLKYLNIKLDPRQSKAAQACMLLNLACNWTKVSSTLAMLGRDLSDGERAAATAVLMSVYSTIARLARTCVGGSTEDAAEELTEQFIR